MLLVDSISKECFLGDHFMDVSWFLNSNVFLFFREFFGDDLLLFRL